LRNTEKNVIYNEKNSSWLFSLLFGVEKEMVEKTVLEAIEKRSRWMDLTSEIA
jgi:hypothetical protein